MAARALRREFVNTPSQSWWLNDLGNDTRRVYIGQEHKNMDGTHSPEGDSVGFWVDDMLIIHLFMSTRVTTFAASRRRATS